MGQDNITLNFTGGGSDKYLILRGTSGFSSTPPVDGVGYSAGSVLGTSSVIYSGSSTSFQDLGLFQPTYYYTIYAYNGSGNAVAYQTNNPLQGSQALGGNVYYSLTSGNFHDPTLWSVVGPGGSPVNDVPGTTSSSFEIVAPHTVTLTQDLPVSGTVQSGAILNANGNDILMFGDLTVNGELPNAGILSGDGTVTGNSLLVFDKLVYGIGNYNGSGITLGSDIVVLNGITEVDDGDPMTTSYFDLNGFTAYPCVPPTQSPQNAVYNNQLGNSMTLGWTRGNGTGGVLVIARESTTSQVKPDFKVYTANANLSSGDETMPGSKNYVVYKGTGTSVTITGLKPNTYYDFGVYEFNGTNCYDISNFLGAGSDSGTPPPIIALVTPSDLCEGQTFTISGSNFGLSTPTVTVNSQPAIVGVHSQTSITVTAGTSPGGTLKVTNNDNTLSTTYGSPLQINANPQAFTVTGGGMYCSNTTGIKVGLANSQTGTSYDLYKDNQFTNTTLAGTGAAIDFGLLTAVGTYSVKAITTVGCKQDMNGTVAISIKPVVAGSGVIVSDVKSLCVGESTTLNVSGITNVDSYTWTLPPEVAATPISTSSTLTIKALAAATANISVAGVNACGTGTPVSTSIDINLKPKASIEGPSAEKQIVNDELEFTAIVENTNNFVTTIWDFGNGSTAEIPTATSRYESTGNYTVVLTVKDGNGCGDEAQYPLTIIEFPSLISSSIKNVVTANGDGKNDLLIISDIDRFPENHVTVLDRWGIEVFSKDNYSNDWNFTKGSTALPAGNYVCIVKLGSDNVITRNITLIQK